MHRAVVDRLRDVMAGIDVTQPQWWVLTRADIGDGLTREDIAAQLTDVADTPYEVPRTGLRAEVHEGIPDEDYVTALKVMRRMIGNIESAVD